MVKKPVFNDKLFDFTSGNLISDFFSNFLYILAECFLFYVLYNYYYH